MPIPLKLYRCLGRKLKMPKLAITHTIAIKWKEKYDAVVVDCHHRLRLCGDRMKMGLHKKGIFYF